MEAVAQKQGCKFVDCFVAPAPILPAFGLRQKVWIPELAVPGVVLALYIAETGTQYSVRYFFNGAPQTVYFFAPELEAFRDPRAAP